MIQLLLYAAVLLLGAAFVAFFFQSSNLLVVIGLFFCGLGLYQLIQLLPYRSLRRHPILEKLYGDPGRIVWVYSVVTQRMPYGLEVRAYGLLYFKLVDGEDLCVSMPARHLRIVSRCLNRMLPHATFGYSPNKEQLYRIDPQMLIN